MVYEKLKIEYINHKGYGVAHLDGKEFWALNCLPGEVVDLTVNRRKNKARLCEIVKFHEQSEFRVKPLDSSFLSTSPLQIASADEEDRIKIDIVKRKLEQECIELEVASIISPEKRTGYRNKMEYSFYVDDDGISLAFNKRDSKRGKIKVQNIAIASELINNAVATLMFQLNTLEVKTRDLKCLLARSSEYEQKVILAIYIKDKAIFNEISKIDFAKLPNCKALSIIYSNPLSPAAVTTEILLTLGEMKLTEKIGNKLFTYDYDSFFQNHIEMFEKLLNRIAESGATKGVTKLLDIYSGVGSIGLSLSEHFNTIVGIESYEKAIELANLNSAQNSVTNYTQHVGLAENMIEALRDEQESLWIFDPPRSGLHNKVIEELQHIKPKQFIYISCNPITQIENIKKLLNAYEFTPLELYNFYPMTTHCESITFAQLKSAV